MAVNRVERLLEKVTGALNAAGVDYAVIGGNAVAAWVATVEQQATRTTKDVDLLVRRDELARIESVLTPHGFRLIEFLDVRMFVPRRRPNPRTGMHLLFANELVRPNDPYPTPDPATAATDIAEFRVIDLPGLLRLKLQAFRRVDQVHIEDLLRVGLIDAALADNLPEDLRRRLCEIRDTMEWFTEPPQF